MTEWRVLHGWTEPELLARLAALASARRNFAESADNLARRPGWNQYRSEAVVAYEPPGSPVADGYFERARVAVANYQFSDPAIVRAHFDPRGDLLHRRLLLEIRVLVLRYLCGAAVAAVEDRHEQEESRFGFRYDTLEGHIERGAEWFILTKEHATGQVRFRIAAAWQPGDFPNWWSRLGFRLLVRRYQLRWHRRAHQRLVRLIHSSVADLLPEERRLVTQGPRVQFTWGPDPHFEERESVRRT